MTASPAPDRRLLDAAPRTVGRDDDVSPRPGGKIAALRARGFSPIAIGCGRIGSLSNAVAIEQSREMLRIAAARGISLLDTAGIYGSGLSEEIVADHARHHPGTYVMTKIGRHHSAAGRMAHRMTRWARPMIGARVRGYIRSVRDGGVHCDFSPAALEAGLAEARGRFGESRINAILLHSPPVAALADLDTMATLVGFRERGLADQVGVSCDDLEALRCIAARDPLDIVQMPLRLYQDAVRTDVLERLLRQDVAIILRGVLWNRGGRSMREAIADAARLPGVSSVIIGVSTPAHLLDII